MDIEKNPSLKSSNQVSKSPASKVQISTGQPAIVPSCANVKARYLHFCDLTGTPETTDWQLSAEHDSYFIDGPITGRAGSWAIAWGDLMMTMFVLFLVLFVFKISDITVHSKNPNAEPVVVQELNVNKQVKGPERYEVHSFTTLYDFSNKIITSQDLQNFATTTLASDTTLKIILTADLLFPIGQASLLPAAQKSLQKISALLKQTPYSINIVGHTDNLPISSSKFPSNWELSTSRAGAVARFLISETQIPANRFHISGYAHYRPLANNNTSGNRAKNRRVEIIISREGLSPQPFESNILSTPPIT